MQAGIPDQEESEKDRKMILREEKAKKKKREKKDGICKKIVKELLREVTIKIGLERVDI